MGTLARNGSRQKKKRDDLGNVCITLDSSWYFECGKQPHINNQQKGGKMNFRKNIAAVINKNSIGQFTLAEFKFLGHIYFQKSP